MSIGGFFRSLFSPAKAKPASRGEAVEHKGYQIIPAPQNAGGQYRTAGFICRDHLGETQEVEFIRADLSTTWELAQSHSIQKGKQIIDEQGESIFK